MQPPDNHRLREQALALIEAGELTKACTLFGQISKIDPQDVEALMMLGAIKGELGQAAEAVVYLRHAVELDPDYTEAWAMLGGLLGQLNEMEQAEQCSRRVLELDPESVDAHMNLANTLFHQGKLDEAVENYRKVLAQQPSLSMAWLMLGRAHARAEQWREAENALRQALILDPRLVEAHLELGNVCKMEGRFDEARSHYEQALGLNPSHAEAHASFGALLYSQGHFDGALASYLQSLRLNPHQSSVYHNLGVLQQALGRPAAEAEASYREAVRLQPDFIEAHHNLGRLLMAQGDRQHAAESFEQILRFKPDNAIARYMLSALGAAPAPSTAPSDYVAGLFDDYAARFDKHLVQELQYRIPEYLRTAVGRALGQSHGQLNVLDLGCGTGLCGPLFRDLAARLTGVDLSAGMIDKARERRVYDELHLEDITTFLQSSSAVYDLIIAADVFVYVGELTGVFAACKAALKPGGYFAFSLEAADDSETYLLRPTGRYAQSSRYIRELVQAQMLHEVDFDQVVVRMTNGAPIPGYVFILRRPQS